MAYKILTKNGIDNSNIDGARGEYFNSGMRDGIVQGALNEGLFTATASNIISLDTCELRIAGHRIVIDEPVYHTFTNAPSSDTRYAFVAQIVVDDNQNVDFSLFVQTANTPLIQNDLYKTITGAGTYQIEIGRFTLLTTLTIEEVVRTIDVITGGTGKGSGSTINIGTVTTQTLDSDVDAEVDVSERYEEDEDKEYLDFTFGIPKAEVNVDAVLSTTSENAIQNKVVTTALNEKLGNSGEQTITDGILTVSKTMTIVDDMSNTSRTTTKLSQLDQDGLIIGELKETTTSSGSDTVAKHIQYDLSGIELNYTKIVDIYDNGVFNFKNTVTISGTVSNLNTISQPVNSVVTYSFSGGCANAPITDSGMVIQYQVSTAYCTQLVIANDENASTWRRSYRDGTWTEWEKLSKLKSKTFTSIIDFYNFMQDNIDSVSEVIITPSANITGNQTNLNITSSESTFMSSSPTVLQANFEYRFNQFTKTSANILLGGKGFTTIVGENNLAAVVTSGGMLRFGWNSAALTASNYTIIQAYAQGQYTNLTFKVYYFD